MVFKSTNDYSKDNHRDFHTELVEILHHPHNYLIVAADEERFEIYISKGDIRIFECTRHCSSFEEAEQLTEAFYIYFQDIIAIEQLHDNIKPVAKTPVSDDFYPHRVSVVMPSWSARFNNKRFRAYAEETVALNLPAHIYPEFYWLNIQKLSEFEKLYRKWLESKSAQQAETTDTYSGELIQFLLNNQPLKEQ